MMDFKKVFVPYDGSENAKHAVQYACDMLDRYPNAKVVAFASLAGPRDISRLLGGTDATVDMAAGREVVDRFAKARQENTEKNMARLKEEVSEIAGDKVEAFSFLIEYCSSPVKGILNAIESTGADMVIMGCSGSNAIAGMLGSVTFGVLRSTDVPVTVVK